MLKYKGTFITMFPLLMKKYMVEQYGKKVTKAAFKKAPAIYRQMLSEVEDIGSENPMAGNIYMAFVFMAIWKAADGAIDTDSYRTVVRSFLTKSFARKFIGKSDMNKPEDVIKAKEKFRRMQAWADEHPEYKDKTWDFNFDEARHKDGSFYYFTRCPLNDYARKYGYLEVLPVCCELDHLLTEASKGKLIREYTLATGGPICDYWIVPDKLANPQ
ncbi:L-2-amino-thiazoline-4-carboxylic acid hydrolase [Lachnospiraceae bacterium YSD2013]|nr:L-2-amino-thiazoline-4-carboxylic acid hydrolase [Lachnospiraceae bacterium YSD2013]